MPQRETVAGEASRRSSTSNMMVISLERRSTFPEDRQSFLLSSRTVFNAGRARLKSLSSGERKECLEKREEYFG